MRLYGMLTSPGWLESSEIPIQLELFSQQIWLQESGLLFGNYNYSCGPASPKPAAGGGETSPSPTSGESLPKSTSDDPQLRLL